MPARSTAPASHRALLPVLGLLFTFSGFAALLYQVTWQRMLGLFAGSDVRSITVVVSAYLAGLGLGSLIGARYADQMGGRQALRSYALANLGIAAFAALSPWLFFDWLPALLRPLGPGRAPLLIASLLALLIPTALMGLSMPMIARAVIRQIEGAAELLSQLNGLNTIGAALGALIGGWLLVGWLGFDRAVWVGAALSALVGIGGLLLPNWLPEAPGPYRETPRSSARTPSSLPPLLWQWCALALAAGFLAISLEILWFRILNVTLRSNAYTYAYLLFWFLICDGLGSTLGARWLRFVRDPRRAFLALQGGLALYSLASILALSLLADVEPLRSFIAAASVEPLLLDANNSTLVRVYLLLPLLVIAPPAFAIGINFPLMQAAVQQDLASVGQRVGLLQVANIGGNVLAGLLTGLVLLNQLGSSGSLRLLGLIGLASAALCCGIAAAQAPHAGRCLYCSQLRY